MTDDAASTASVEPRRVSSLSCGYLGRPSLVFAALVRAQRALARRLPHCLPTVGGLVPFLPNWPHITVQHNERGTQIRMHLRDFLLVKLGYRGSKANSKAVPATLTAPCLHKRRSVISSFTAAAKPGSRANLEPLNPKPLNPKPLILVLQPLWRLC